MIASDVPRSAPTLLGVLADYRLLLSNTTLSTTAGRLFILTTAQAAGDANVDTVQDALMASIRGTHALVIDLPEIEERLAHHSLVRLFATGQDRPGMLHEIAKALCTDEPMPDIRYLSSFSPPTAGLPGRCVTDAVIDIPAVDNPEVHSVTGEGLRQRLADVARRLIDRVPGLAQVDLYAMRSGIAVQETQGVSALWPAPEPTSEHSLLIVGTDRPGLVRDVAGRLAAINASIVDSWMIAMGGYFLMAYVCALWDDNTGPPDLAALGVQTSWQRAPPGGQSALGRIGWLRARGEHDHSGIAAFLADAIEVRERRVTDLTARGGDGWSVVFETRGRTSIDTSAVENEYHRRFGEESITVEQAGVS